MEYSKQNVIKIISLIHDGVHLPSVSIPFKENKIRDNFSCFIEPSYDKCLTYGNMPVCHLYRVISGR